MHCSLHRHHSTSCMSTSIFIINIIICSYNIAVAAVVIVGARGSRAADAGFKSSTASPPSSQQAQWSSIARISQPPGSNTAGIIRHLHRHRCCCISIRPSAPAAASQVSCAHSCSAAQLQRIPQPPIFARLQPTQHQASASASSPASLAPASEQRQRIFSAASAQPQCSIVQNRRSISAASCK